MIACEAGRFRGSAHLAPGVARGVEAVQGRSEAQGSGDRRSEWRGAIGSRNIRLFTARVLGGRSGSDHPRPLFLHGIANVIDEQLDVRERNLDPSLVERFLHGLETLQNTLGALSIAASVIQQHIQVHTGRVQVARRSPSGAGSRAPCEADFTAPRLRRESSDALRKPSLYAIPRDSIGCAVRGVIHQHPVDHRSFGMISQVLFSVRKRWFAL